MAITVIHKNNLPLFNGKPLLRMASEKRFSEMIFSLLSEREPNKKELKLFEAILNISIDHGPDTPSTIEVIKKAKKGESISKSIASGINQINDVHGGAIEPAMKLFYNQDKNFKKIVAKYLSEGKKIPGFGHRIYSTDPRSEVLFDLSKKEKIENPFIKLAKDIESELFLVKKRPIPINIDGAIATILCSFGWKPDLGKAVFIIARTPGLVGQFLNHAKVAPSK